MRKRTLALVLVASAIYYGLLLSARAFFPAEFNPPLYFLVAPLVGLILILFSDLSQRATVPSEVRVRKPPTRMLSRQIQNLARQIEVGANSSRAYFEGTVMAKLGEILADKVALETGMDRGRVRETLADPRLGPGLLRNERLHRLLYRPPAAKGSARVKMLEEAIALVESWKP